MLALAFPLLLAGRVASAQDEAAATIQPTPFTVWLDFQELSRPDRPAPAFPIWLESVHTSIALRPEGDVSATSYRIRFRRFATLNRQMLFRIYFEDSLGKNPTVSAWTELGDPVFSSGPLGEGLELPTSESLTIPMERVDYIDLDVPGDGKSVRGVLLSTLDRANILQAVDFALPTQTMDPFEGMLSPRKTENDEEVFGRLQAGLDDLTTTLSRKDGQTVGYDFELGSVPLVGVVTFEILNADVGNPPQVIMNLSPLGRASIALPDLADPGYTGTVLPLLDYMEIRYAGWIRCQCFIPSSTLSPGANTLYIQSASETDAVAVRAVMLQLKYDSRTFDYALKPNVP